MVIVETLKIGVSSWLLEAAHSDQKQKCDNTAGQEAQNGQPPFAVLASEEEAAGEHSTRTDSTGRLVLSDRIFPSTQTVHPE